MPVRHHGGSGLGYALQLAGAQIAADYKRQMTKMTGQENLNKTIIQACFEVLHFTGQQAVHTALNGSA